MGIKLCEHICESGTHKESARKYLNVSGVRLAYDRIWFTGSFEREQHRVVGDDWDIVVTFYKGHLDRQDLSFKTRKVKFQREDRLLIKSEVTNMDRFKHDMSLLRMFGLENVFDV